MSINSVYATAVVERAAVDFRNYLAQMRANAAEFTSGTSTMSRTIQMLKSLDELYALAAGLWNGPLAGTRSSEEVTAIVGVVTELDDLLLAFADAMAVIDVKTVVDLGTGYNPAGSREAKLEALNRGFPFVVFAIPSNITSAAAALVSAIDAYAVT